MTKKDLQKKIDNLNVGDEVQNGGMIAVIIRRATLLKSGKFSKVVTLMYYDGSCRTVNIRDCYPTWHHYDEVDGLLNDLEMHNKSVLARAVCKEDKK